MDTSPEYILSIGGSVKCPPKPSLVSSIMFIFEDHTTSDFCVVIWHLISLAFVEKCIVIHKVLDFKSY